MAAITTRFGRQSTAGEIASEVDLTGRRIVVTGGASGIGIETARALAGAGADVTLAVRDTEAGDRIAVEIAESEGNDNVHVRHLDLADRASIAEFAEEWHGPLHVLVNNAGVMASPEQHTARAGSCSSRPTTSATSHSPPACTRHSRRPATHASSR